MKLGLLFTIGSVSLVALMAATAWGELEKENTDSWLTATALAKIRAKAPNAQIDFVSSKVYRIEEGGRISLRLRVVRGVDSDDVLQEINRISEEAWSGCLLVFHIPPANRLRTIRPTGTQELTLNWEYTTTRQSIPQLPFLGSIKAKSDLSWLVMAPSVDMKQYAESLVHLVAAGQMDNAYHDYYRIRESLNYGNRIAASSFMDMRASEYSVPNPEAKQTQLLRHDLLEACVKIEVYRRDWAEAIYALESTRDHGKDTADGRKAIRRCEQAVQSLYDSLTEAEKKAIRNTEHLPPPIRPVLTAS